MNNQKAISQTSYQVYNRHNMDNEKDANLNTKINETWNGQGENQNTMHKINGAKIGDNRNMQETKMNKNVNLSRQKMNKVKTTHLTKWIMEKDKFYANPHNTWTLEMLDEGNNLEGEGGGE